MLKLGALKTQDLQGLSAQAMKALAEQMLGHIAAQAQVIESQAQAIESKQRDIQLRDAKIERITFELARLKAWRFGARAEAMNAQQRALFEDTLDEDQASLQAQLEALQAQAPAPAGAIAPARRLPRREVLPAHLERVVHRHEPEDTVCPTPDCGQAMTRVGEDVSERLHIVPAQFVVHQHIRGKWACRCCQRRGEGRLVQLPVEPQIINGGIPDSSLVAHTLISRFVDHLPYYRQEAINARAGVHTPRSTLASWSGQGGAALEPLYDAHKAFVLGSRVLHADETTVPLLDPGAGKTKRAYVWAYARGALDEHAGVIYDFCLGRGAKYPTAFLRGWQGTLVRDEYSGYDSLLDARVHPARLAAGCLAHARRKFDELVKANASKVAAQAVRRIAAIYRVEHELAGLSAEQRLTMRQALSKPLWDELHVWLKLERIHVPDGGSTAQAIDYSLNHWAALTRNLLDGAVPVDNNHLENQMRPWAMGRKAWLFAGSELAGQRAAIVMSLVQSAKLSGHDPWAYLTDVLARLPTHLNSRIDELLPHRWKSAA